MTSRATTAAWTSQTAALDVPSELVVGLQKLIRATVRAEIREAGANMDTDPWVPHPRWPCASRRAAVALARSGALSGVKKAGKLFLVRRSSLDAWVEAEDARAKGVELGAGADEDEFSKAMARSGLRRGARRSLK